jgi:hypothetical protein
MVTSFVTNCFKCISNASHLNFSKNIKNIKKKRNPKDQLFQDHFYTIFTDSKKEMKYMHFFSSLNFSKSFTLSVRFVSTRSGKVTFVPDNVQPVAPTVAAAPHVPAHVPSYNEYTPNPNPVLGEPMSCMTFIPWIILQSF